jgi:diguanylate cyclase (GGDEF)-like protein
MRFKFAGRDAQLTASLGIALYPMHALSGEEIISRADNAMYQAKMSGKNRWVVYSDPKLH